MTDTRDENEKKETPEEAPKREESKRESREVRAASKTYAVEKPQPAAKNPQISLALAILLMALTFGMGLLLGGLFLRLGVPAEEEARRGGAGGVPQATSTRLKMEIPADSPFIGPADAPVTIAVFDDFQCPWCEKASHVIDRALKAFPQDVRFVMIYFPLEQLHPQAFLAAQAAAEAAAQGKFKEMHDRIFANQRSISRENLEKWAAEAGLDMARFKSALDQNTHRAVVERHVSMGRSLGVRGTPTILINGRRFNMTRDMDKNFEVLQSIVKEELDIIRQKNIPRGEAWKVLTAAGVATLDQMVSGPQARAADAGKPGNPMRAARREVDPNVSYKVEFDPSDAWKGDPKALVTIVEFSDYQCPHCRSAEDIMAQILEAYPTGVRIVFLNNPLRFHPQAMPAAVAALEVKAQKGLDAFWAFHKKLFENQQQISPENLEKWLTEAGVDLAQYKAAVENKTHEATIGRHQGLALKFGARGTPAFFINGYFLSGARPLDQFKSIIDREMQKAKQAIAEGKTTAENYYAFLMASAEPQVKWIGGEAGQPNQARRPLRPRLDTTKVYRVWPEGGEAEFKKIPYFGDPQAPVVVMMALDLECPWCEKLMPTLDELLEGTPVLPGTQPGPDQFAGYKKGVRFVLLHFPLPFHKNAMLAHQAVQEVFEQKGPEGFRNFMKKCFQNQKSLNRASLEAWAQEAGVNMARFREALDKETHKPFIEKLQQMGRAVGVQGTPAIYVNGRFLLGRGLPVFRKSIDEAREQAEALMKKGVAPAKVYEEIMKTAEPKAIWIQPDENAKGGAPGPQVQIQKVEDAAAAPSGANLPPSGFRPPVSPRVIPLQPKPLPAVVPSMAPVMNP